ncbi:MAG: oligosaccharide flippase family protein [Bacteroidetes bacterium]|nr:oligosaccharide flippase family protein [Bacteroidota bacterium]
MLNFKKRLDGQSKLLIKNSGWVFFSNFFSTGLAFIRSVIIARGLGPGIFGTYAIVVSFVGLIQEFLNLNVGTAVIKFGAVYHTEKRNDKLLALVKSSLYISLIMALVSVIVIAILCTVSYSTFIEEPHLEWFIIWYAVAASITYVNSISRGLLRLYYKFRMSSLIQMIMDVIETGAIAIAVFFYPKDLNVFFVAIIITRFLNGFICNLLAYYELRHELNPYLSTPIRILEEEKKSIFGFIFGNSVGNSLKTVISQGDVLLLGILSNPAQVGFYSVAKKLAYSVLTLTDPLTQSIYPQLSKLIAERRFREIRKMLFKITGIAMLPGIAFLAVTYFLNKWIIVTVYGIDYAPASDAFYYFLIGAVLGAATFWTLPLVQSLGIVTVRIKIYVMTIFLGSLLAYLLVPAMQSAGLSLALLVTNILNMVIFIYVADNIFPRSSVSDA